METALFLWFAGISEGWSNALKHIGFIVLFSSLIWLVLCVLFKDGIEDTRHFHTEKEPRPTTTAVLYTAHYKGRWPHWLAIIGFVMFSIGLTLPNKDTMYLMAGGYFGQKVVQSDTVSKVKLIIDAELDKQLSKYTKKE